MIEPISHALLEDPNGRIRHGFFGRIGGVSEGLYRSLNCGHGSGDDLRGRAREPRAGDERLRAVRRRRSAPHIRFTAPKR